MYLKFTIPGELHIERERDAFLSGTARNKHQNKTVEQASHFLPA